MKLAHKLINPVLEKEIRLRMRSWRSPIALMLYLAAIGLLGFGFMFTMNSGIGADVISPERSRNFFYFLSFSQLALISFMTPGLTSGAISGEREKQTLNMLLTTQQSSTTIIMSKLISSISFMLFIVIATLPIYSIVFLYGGISPTQLLAVFLFFIFVMVALASFSIMFSTLFKRTMVAVTMSYGLLLFIYGFTAFIALIIGALTTSDALPHFILGLNPVTALWSILDPSANRLFLGDGERLHYWLIFIIVYSVLCALALFISIRYLRPILKRKR